MNDEKTAADYKVSGGSVLHLDPATAAETYLFWEADERREDSCRLQSFGRFSASPGSRSQRRILTCPTSSTETPPLGTPCESLDELMQLQMLSP